MKKPPTNEERMTAAQAAIRDALALHGCEMFAVPWISDDGRIGAAIQLRTLPPPPELPTTSKTRGGRR